MGTLDIDILATTEQQRIVGGFLATRYGITARQAVNDAAAILQALDEDVDQEEVDYQRGVEVAARTDAVMALSRLYSGTVAPEKPLDVDGFLEVADQIAAYIRNGKATT